MVKFILYLTKLILITAFAILFASCDFSLNLGPAVKGDGNVVTENRNNDAEFTGVEASRALDVEIEQSNDRSITVIADKNLQSHIITQVEHGVLKISADADIKNAESKKIIVKMPVIDALQSSSAATITSKRAIRSHSLSLGSSSAGFIDVLFEGETLSAETSSGGHIYLSGKTLRLETTSSSGSVIEADKLLANDVTSTSSSGSNTKIRPLVNLEAKASSGSSITYYNKPKNNLIKKSSSGGSISEQ